MKVAHVLTLGLTFLAAPALAAGLPAAATTTAAKAPTAAESIDAGLEALTRGDNSAAVAAFRLAVHADPDDRAARRLLADSLRRVDRCQDALTQYQLLQSSGADDDARRGEVGCLRALNQNDTALRIVQDVAARHPAKDGQRDALGEWAAAELASLAQVAPATRATAAVPVKSLPKAADDTPQRADSDSPEAMDAQGEAFFAAGKYGDAAAWFGLSSEAAPTAERSWRLAMARLGAGDLLAALVAVDQTLARDPKHAGALKTRPMLAEWVRNRGKSGTAVPMIPAGRSIRMAVLQALVDGDDVLARQLLPLWRSGPEKGIVAELVQAELWLRDNRLTDADKVLRAILARKPGHPGALKALAEVVILRGEFMQARAMLNLPVLRKTPGEDPNADLYRFMLRRRGEWQQQIRMAVDPGVKPLPALSQQLAEMEPPPPPPEEPVAPPPPPPPEPAKAKHAGKKLDRTIHRPAVPKALMTRVHKPAPAKHAKKSKKSGK